MNRRDLIYLYVPQFYAEAIYRNPTPLLGVIILSMCQALKSPTISIFSTLITIYIRSGQIIEPE